MDLSSISPHTLAQFLTHINPNQPSGGLFNPKDMGINSFYVRLDDSPALNRLAELEVKRQISPLASEDFNREDRAVILSGPIDCRMPH